MDLKAMTSVDLFNWLLNIRSGDNTKIIRLYTDELERRGEVDLLHSLVINLAFREAA
jgi:hypothetical protein